MSKVIYTTYLANVLSSILAKFLTGLPVRIIILVANFVENL